MTVESTLKGPDVSLGVDISTLTDGAKLRGHVDGKDAIMVRCDDELFVIGAFCSHYQGPLEIGLVVDDQIRCPWHYACFSLRNVSKIEHNSADNEPQKM